MNTALSIFLVIVSICSGIVTIGGFITFVLKGPRKWISNIVKEVFREEIQPIKEDLNFIHEKLDKNKEATICSARHDITGIYEKYKHEKKLPELTKQDLVSLYDSYKVLGGNSYVDRIYNECMSWDTI